MHVHAYMCMHTCRFPWGKEAFEKAVAEDKPIFLSVGYSTCHWCHVMERESFTDPSIGALLDQHFVSVKVDREERPDVDRVYMTFVQVCVYVRTYTVHCAYTLSTLHVCSICMCVRTCTYVCTYATRGGKQWTFTNYDVIGGKVSH